MPSHDLTNQRLCEITGLSPSTISRLRSGQQLPSWDTIHRIYNTLGWSISAQVTAIVRHVYAAEFNDYIEWLATPTPTPGRSEP